MSTTRLTGPLRAGSLGQREESSATGRGRGGSLSSRGGIISNYSLIVRNHGRKHVISVYKYAVFFSFSSQRECTSVSKSKPTLWFAVI